jgi:hypothetical protein
LGTDAGRPALTRAACKVLVRLLRHQGDPAPAFDLDDQAADVPLAGSWWLGFVKGADEVMGPVSLAPTLGATWDGVLSCPLRGAIVMAPTDPPSRPAAATDNKEAACMAEHQGGETFTVELLALPGGVPPVVRLRTWLKSALRAARFRALSVRQTPQLPPPAACENDYGSKEGATVRA